MKTPAVGNRALFAAFLLVCLASGCGRDDTGRSQVVTGGFPLYGPGAHWLDDVRAGTVQFDAAATVEIDVNGDGAADSSIEVSGPTSVARSSARSRAPGSRHRTHLDLEIVEMVLRGPGVAVRAGDGNGNFVADGPLFSLGSSDEAEGAPERADDLFRIFFELEVGAAILHNREALLVAAAIDRLPPLGNVFTAQGDAVALYDREGNESPLRILTVHYRARPPRGNDGAEMPETKVLRELH